MGDPIGGAGKRSEHTIPDSPASHPTHHYPLHSLPSWSAFSKSTLVEPRIVRDRAFAPHFAHGPAQ
jgi:hypothetical protein